MSSFAPERLIIARERRGLSRSGLAANADVAEKSIRNYESGADIQRPAAVEAIATALQMPSSFFYGSPLEDLGETAASFRAASKLPQYRRRAALAAGVFAMHVVSYMTERFELPSVEIPDLEGYEPEIAADAVRAAWGLGAGPIMGIVQLLEANGVLVFALAEDCRELDAFSFWRWDRPFVLLNTMKSAERSRLDAAHELAHLVLHRDVPEIGKHQEDEAQQFAGAFLLPRSSVLASARRASTLSEVLAQKRQWRVSATAYTRRLFQLDLLTEWQYRSLMIELAKRGYRSGEPDGTERDTSHLMGLLLADLRNDGITLTRLAHQLDMNVDDLRSLMLGLTTIGV